MCVWIVAERTDFVTQITENCLIIIIFRRNDKISERSHLTIRTKTELTHTDTHMYMGSHV